jgi:integrase
VRQKPDISGLEMERLLVHSITDDSALKLYLPAVRQFIAFVELHGIPADSWPHIDLALTAYMTTLCYSRDQHFAAGSMTINGLCYLVPELTTMLPRAWRSLRAWERLTIAKEGGPMAPQALVCMSAWLMEQQRPDAACASDMIEMALDTYAREQDMVNLRVCDIMDDPEADVMMLKFGASHRGESSKTGRDQGVRVDWPHTRRILRRRCAGKKPDQKVFQLSAAVYRKWWHRAGDAVLGPAAAGPPHSARHTGASRDLAQHYRDFSQIQRRGRWKTASSVQRYAKTLAFMEAVLRVPPAVKKEGDDILAGRPPRSVEALE